MSDTPHIHLTTSEGNVTIQAAIGQVLAHYPSIVIAILFGSLAAG